MKLQSGLLACLIGGLVAAPCASIAADTFGADASLTNFVEAVVIQNPRVQAARSALDASGARRDAASRPLYNPSLSLEAEDINELERTIGISQSIDWANKREARTSVAESDRQVTQAEFLAIRWGVIVELLHGLALHYTGVERDELATERMRLMREFADLAKRRFDAGDLAQVDLDAARIAATDARIQKANAAAALAEARQAVRNLTPRSPTSEWPGLSAALPAIEANTDPETLVMTLPSVRAALGEVDVASAMVQLRQRETRPDPTLSVAGGKEGEDTLLRANVTIPLFVRNRFSHEVTAALAARSQAEQVANDVMQRAYARIVSAGERYRQVRSAWRDWDSTGSASLSRQRDQISRLWRAGELSTTDYLVQIRQTLDVQENALDLRHSLWRAWFEWLEASGRIDAWLGLQPAV